MILKESTDLGSLIGTFDCATLILREINLADFSRPKTSILTILAALNFDFRNNFTLEMSKGPKKSKFRADQMVKLVVLGSLQNDLKFKSISRKI